MLHNDVALICFDIWSFGITNDIIPNSVKDVPWQSKYSLKVIEDQFFIQFNCSDEYLHQPL